MTLNLCFLWNPPHFHCCPPRPLYPETSSTPAVLFSSVFLGAARFSIWHDEFFSYCLYKGLSFSQSPHIWKHKWQSLQEECGSLGLHHEGAHHRVGMAITALSPHTPCSLGCVSLSRPRPADRPGGHFFLCIARGGDSGLFWSFLPQGTNSEIIPL